MNAFRDFMDSLRADLLDRRMMPILALVIVLLIGAVAYAATGGNGGSEMPLYGTPAAAPATATGTTGIAIIQVAKGSTGAVAEVTGGTELQHSGPSRDPLAAPPVPKSKAKAAAGSTGVTGSTGSTGSTGKSGSSTSRPAATTAPATTPKTPAPAPSKQQVSVSIAFGVVPAGTGALVSGLTPYLDLHSVTPLPSAKEALIKLAAVSLSGRKARFKFIQPMIPAGAARCMPSATQCETIELKAGQYEELEYAPPSGGSTVVYQLQLLSITSGASSA